MGKHRARLSRLTAAVLATVIVQSMAFGNFSIKAEANVFRSGERLVLTFNDLDSRQEKEIASFVALDDGSLNYEVASFPGVYSLKRASGTVIAIAVANGQTVELKRENERESEIVVANSPDTERLNQYENFRKSSLERIVYPIRKDISQAKKRRATLDEIEKLTQEEVDAYQAHLRELNDFAISEIGSSIALYATSLRWNGDYKLDELSTVVLNFTNTHGDIPIAKSMQNRLDRFAKVALGRLAPELVGKDLNGQTRSLSSLRGKYVLLDFWAAWCAPCRLENKHYSTLVKERESDDFEIFAINLDKNRSAWARASKQDNMSWIQISDLQGWQSPLPAAYNVSALPASFLLDPEGRIVAKNLRGKALDDLLKELLKESN